MISKLSQTLRSLVPGWGSVQTVALDFGRSVAITSVVVSALVMGGRQLGLLQTFELNAFDQLLRLRADEGPDERLLVVTITEEDIRNVNEYPISDATLNQLLGKLEALEPRVIGIDIIRDVPIGQGREELLQRLQTSDNIVAVCKMASSATNPGFPPPPGMAEGNIVSADLPVDAGGILRRTSLVLSPPLEAEIGLSNPTGHLCSDPNTVIPALSLEVAIRYLEAEGTPIDFVLNEKQEPEGLQLGSQVVKRLQPNTGGYRNVDAAGFQLLINYRAAKQATRELTLTQVLKGDFNPEWVKGKAVLVGYTAASVKDDFYTPYSGGQREDQKMPGVVIHAQAASQLLSAALDQRPLFRDWSKGSEGLWILAWSVVGGTLAWRVGHPLRFGLASGVLLGVLVGSCYILFVQAIWIPLAPAAVSFLATAGGVVLVDRFNKGGYSKAIYDRVKGFFKIEIDEEQKSSQVAEIVESDYFQELQQKALDLRNRKSDGSETSAPSTILQPMDELTTLDKSSESAVAPAAETIPEATADTPLSSPPESTPEASSTPTSPSEETEDAELDYFQQLQQKAKAMKKQNQGSNE